MRFYHLKVFANLRRASHGQMLHSFQRRLNGTIAELGGAKTKTGGIYAACSLEFRITDS